MIRYDLPTHCNGKEQIGLQQLRYYVMNRWGGVDGGIYYCRPVRGGSAMSLHSEGRAWDWQQTDRRVFLDAFHWVISHANELQVQRVTDYLGRTSWDARYTGSGFRSFTGEGAGSLPNWHVERNWYGAHDARPIDDIIRPDGPPVVVEEVMPQPTDIVDALVVGGRSNRQGIKLQYDGGVICHPSVYFGSYPGLQDKYRRGNRGFVAITPRRDRKADGYTCWADDGSYYDFGPDKVAYLRPEARPR